MRPQVGPPLHNIPTSSNKPLVSYDTGYDDASRSLTAVSCSDGANGLITRYGWQTQGNVANFPNIGGSSTIAGWNSDQVCSLRKLPPYYVILKLSPLFLTRIRIDISVAHAIP